MNPPPRHNNISQVEWLLSYTSDFQFQIDGISMLLTFCRRKGSISRWPWTLPEETTSEAIDSSVIILPVLAAAHRAHIPRCKCYGYSFRRCAVSDGELLRLAQWPG